MDFSLSDEQRLIQDGLRRLLQKSYSFEQRDAYRRAPGGWSAEMWRHYSDMGLLALPFAEKHGGLSGSPVETMILMEEFGRALTLEPYVATIVLAGGVLRHAGSDEQIERLAERIMPGAFTLALAHDESDAEGNFRQVETIARQSEGAWRIDGVKSFAIHAGSADALIVSGRVEGAPSDEAGIGLFLVDARQDGVTINEFPLHDAHRAATVTLAGVKVDPTNVLGRPGDGYRALARVHDEAIAATCAEAVGVMSELHEMTIEFLKQRRQFGVHIGRFQALQHRAAEMFIALEQARSMALFATMMCAEEDPLARANAMSAAKVQIGRSGRWIGEQAVQLHGGIAIASEFRAGHYFKKLTVLDKFMGDADHHLDLLGVGDGLFVND